MIGLLVWMLGALVLAIEITSRHLWHEIAAAMLGALFVLWTLCGFFLLSMKGKWPGSQQRAPIPSPETIARFRELQQEKRAQQAAGGK